MGHPLRLLIIDDRQPDAELSASQIARGGYSCTWRRVETEEEFRTELREFAPDLILSDFTLPRYNGLAALALAVAEAPDVPFIFVSGSIGEKRAAEALSHGASDYVHKSDLPRLVQVVARALGGDDEGLQADAPTVVNSSLLDPLTGLPRRSFFTEYLSQHLLRSEQSETTTVIVVDIERLRAFNEAHGSAVGDKLIQSVAERLQRRFGQNADLAHFGGGTFAAVFAESRSRSDATRDSSTAIFGQQFAVDDQGVQVIVKCGLARYPADGVDAETLLENAEAALEGIKARRERPAAHVPCATDAADARRGMLERRLGKALEEHNFCLHYQPLIERVSGRVTAVEALLRWRDPELGLIAPHVFLPILERTGLIGAVGEWVFDQAARDFEQWHSTGLPRLRVAVNISRTELLRTDFAAVFLEKTRRAHTSPCIDIEIPESALGVELQLLRQTLRTLRGEGVRIAIDDFGMTQASLSRLGELPVDSLKIDRSFISRLTSQPESQAIVTAIIALARSYGLRTVAEGVENIEQLKILDTLGCEQSQGYLHSPAVSSEELALLVATRSLD
ncbi:MAG TPA: GGDEF domain-containing response regulator [Steroidobacteraceae bacterium]|jgi:diguanylate cyclase (GGDEF)-like protein